MPRPRGLQACRGLPPQPPDRQGKESRAPRPGSSAVVASWPAPGDRRRHLPLLTGGPDASSPSLGPVAAPPSGSHPGAAPPLPWPCRGDKRKAYLAGEEEANQLPRTPSYVAEGSRLILDDANVEKTGSGVAAVGLAGTGAGDGAQDLPASAGARRRSSGAVAGSSLPDSVTLETGGAALGSQAPAVGEVGLGGVREARDLGAQVPPGGHDREQTGAGSSWDQALGGPNLMQACGGSCAGAAGPRDEGGAAGGHSR
ncbi:Hypothetical predicted protein [Pelobates cultripes]|uniref:Uncharacterized protein n=1 Tax=Pelobates cultripes TaxID=61616 RepID=A0AAD1QXC0_PELCU|nr:Hypothetical predicted protein [Pelobates cultripes]